MPPPPDIALQMLFDDLAAANKENGSPVTLAWHNLFVVNQLALVSHHWHKMVSRYSHCTGTAAVYKLFAFAAHTRNMLLCCKSKQFSFSGRRNELPSEFQCRVFTDQVFDNVCAIVQKMIAWRPRPRNQKQRPQLSVSYGRPGQMRICGDWLVIWKPYFLLSTHGFFMLHRSASEPQIFEDIQRPNAKAMSLRRCRSTSCLIPLELSDGPCPL
jgi:hypothetical protein